MEIKTPFQRREDEAQALGDCNSLFEFVLLILSFFSSAGLMCCIQIHVVVKVDHKNVQKLTEIKSLQQQFKSYCKHLKYMLKSILINQ